MSELECCPFCGGEAEIRHNVLWFWAQCKKCNANSRESSNEDLAIEYWNTRTPMANIVEKLEELKEKGYAELTMLEVNELMDKAINIVKSESKNGSSI